MLKRILKPLSLILSIVLFVGILAACSNSDNGNKEEVAKSAEKKEEVAKSAEKKEEVAKSAEKKEEVAKPVVQLELWHWWDGLHQKLLQEYVDKYNQSQIAVNVNVVYVPYKEYSQKLLISAAGNQLPDILVYGNNETPIYAEAGVLEDISGKMNAWERTNQMFEGVRDTHMVGDKYYGVPLYANALALFYNTDLIKTPPATWDELKQVAKELSTGDRYGLAVSAIASEEGTFQFLPFLWSTGEDMNTIDSPNAVKALQLWKDLINQGSMSKEIVNWTQQDALIAFQTGRAAMMVNGPWNVPPLLEKSPDLNWALTNVPIDKEARSILGGGSLGIGKGKNVDAAWQFFEWLLAPDTLTDLLTARGDLPGFKDVAKRFEDDPIRKSFLDQIAVAKTRSSYGPKYNEISKAIQTAIAKTLAGNTPAEEALKEAAKTIKPIIQN